MKIYSSIIRLASFALILICIGSTTPKEYPQEYFEIPIDGSLRLSGTFGELRSNHFHSGIDIKPSSAGAADPIYAAAEGKIVRISVSGSGFGNALYIQHPNGYTTVYAHLKDFIPEIATYVKKMQYQKRSFRVNLYPGEAFPVKKRDLIGYMGNSGGSLGVHLHFEIRNSSNSKPINPLHFGLAVEDHVKPHSGRLAIYHLDAHNQTQATHTFSKSELTKYDTLFVPAGRLGLGIESIDKMDNLTNKNGVYSLKALVEDSILFAMQFDEFHFSETRYLNAHTDYACYRTEKKMLHRLFNLPGNQFSLCKVDRQSGHFDLAEDDTMNIQLILSDYNDNRTIIDKTVIGTNSFFSPSAPNSHFLDHQKDQIIRQEGMVLELPKGSLYQDCHVHYLRAEEESSGHFSPVHMITADPIPLHAFATIKVKPNSLPPHLHKKAIVARYDEKELVNCGGTWSDDYLSTRVRSLGNYLITVDTIAPVIQPIKFEKNLTGKSQMSWTITDNMATSGKAKDLKYQATVDGQWILMEHDPKRDLIFHRFDDKISPGTHQISLEVTDDRGNKAKYNRTFVR